MRIKMKQLILEEIFNFFGEMFSGKVPLEQIILMVLSIVIMTTQYVYSSVKKNKKAIRAFFEGLFASYLE